MNADAASLTAAQSDAVDRAIDALWPKSLDLLKRMVATNSINPMFPGIRREDVIGGETKVAGMLADFLDAAGLTTHAVARDPDRVNRVAVMKGSGGGRSLLINGHVDTVAPFKAESWWTGDPWKPEVRDGRLYGLGSTDMKSGLVSAALAAAALKAAGIRLKGELQIHAVIGEETMGHEFGTSAVLDAGFVAEGGIVVEPTSQPLPLTVSPVGAGNFNMHIDVKGFATHCGNRGPSIRAGGPGMAAGVNAVEKAVLIVQALKQLEEEWGTSKTHAAFPAGFFTLLPAVFHGDAGVPSVGYISDHATIGYLIWYPPGNSAEHIRNEIEAQVRRAAEMDPWLRLNPPVVHWDSNWPVSDTDPSHPLVRSLVDARTAVLGAIPAGVSDTAGFNACCDSAFIEQKGIPSVIFGPGDLRCAHSIDEFVNLSEVVDAARILARGAARWCGVA
ncbi:MAG: acetylornithine deacetylase/succinyl-diaminopimelate desuccinylase [Rhizobium sp.]|nr:acetylornithine deacetylase/succinyl-diaminopimelate desuccinylase [Rhizobium sp.]